MAISTANPFETTAVKKDIFKTTENMTTQNNTQKGNKTEHSYIYSKQENKKESDEESANLEATTNLQSDSEPKNISTLGIHQKLSTSSISPSITANKSFKALLNSPIKLPKVKVDMTTSGSATNHYFKPLSLQQAAILALTAIYLL